MKRVLFVMLALVLAIGLSPVVQASSCIEWDGQGRDSLDCSDPPDGFNTTTGWIHWVLTQAEDVTDAVLTLSGSGDGTYSWTKRAGHMIHFHTPYFDVTTLNAKICYSGSLGKNPQFNISDFCPGEGPEPIATLSVAKFYDTNADGVWDYATEAEIPGWNITVNGVPGSTPYSEKLPPCIYEVTELMPDEPGWQNTTPTSVNVTLSPGAVVTVYFGNVKESLAVEKSAETSYTRTHDWSIDKAVEPDEIWLSVNGSNDTTVKWTINATYEGYEDSNHKVCGNVTITNNGTIPVTITKVEDFLGKDKIPVEVNFGVTFPCIIGVGETLTGTYCVSVADKISGHNLAIVYTERGGEYEAKSEELVWGDPTTEIHRIVEVWDRSDIFGCRKLATLDAHDYEKDDVITFTYEKPFRWAEYPECGNYIYKNTAEVIGDDEEVLDSDDATLKVKVQCLVPSGGRTLGFWSNRNGQALFNGDDLTAMVNLNLRNADGTHFNPGNYGAFKTWLLSAKATNMAYMLSAQLAAMRLNVLNGFVDGSAYYIPYGGTINQLIAEADASLGTHGRTLAGHPQRAYQERLKNYLDALNNGALVAVWP